LTIGAVDCGTSVSAAGLIVIELAMIVFGIQSRRKRDAVIVRGIASGRASVRDPRDRRLDAPGVRRVSHDRRRDKAVGWRIVALSR